VLGAWVAAASATLAAHGRFGWLGLAPGQAGQTAAQVEAPLGTPLRPALPAAKVNAACQLRSVASPPGVVYVVDKDVVTRRQTRDARDRDARDATVSGVRVGDSVKKAQRAYGERLTTSPRLHFAQSLTMAVYSPNRQLVLVMESNDDGRIITLRGGLLAAVEYLQGCSP
jgi:hypothetical protein